MGRTYGDEDEDFCEVVEEAVVNAAVSVKRDVSGRGMGLGESSTYAMGGGKYHPTCVDEPVYPNTPKCRSP